MRIKSIFIVVLALILILPTLFITTSANDKGTSDNEEPATHAIGSITAKDEVVYANLSATGELENIYVVNIFDIAKEGAITDFGSYSTVKNLTDLSSIKQANDSIQFTATEDKFYYQGNMDDGEIPWKLDISYFLDGNKVDPDLLAGKEGSLKMFISTSANENVDSSFYENFMLQISLELNTDVFEDIHVPQATIAHVGKNKQATFTVMPGEDETFNLEANVNNFSFSGIQIAAIPFNMQIDLPDIDSMTTDLESLADAIEQLNNGVATLKSGVTELSHGVGELASGSSEYSTNINKVAASSEGLTSASKEIQGALEYMSHSLGAGIGKGSDLGQLKEVAIVLSQLSDEMLGMISGLTELKDGYVEALTNLTAAIKNIPDIPEETIYSLSTQGNQEVNMLIDAYIAAQGVKQLFMNDQFQLAFVSIAPTIEGVNLALTEIGGALKQIAKEFDGIVASIDLGSSIGELAHGLSQLSNNYGDFHLGLTSYTDGITQLAAGYSELHNGLVQLDTGTKELKDGVAELHDGTKELHDATKNMPEQMEEEIDSMMADFDYSDYKPVSFVSNKNEGIQSVQFIIQTKGIELIEEKVIEEEKEEGKKSFWTLLLDLFR